MHSDRVRRIGLWLILPAAALGCASDDDYPSEMVSAAEWDIALAMIREGDSIYVARATRLDRIDARTGGISRVAGHEWSACPTNDAESWRSTILDWAYPHLAVRETTLFLVGPRCGVWSFDFATGTKHMLVDPSIETKEKRAKAEGQWPKSPAWNGKDGPDWQSVWGMAIAREGDHLLACFPANSTATSPADPRHEQLELWSIDFNGTPVERLAAIAPSDGEEFCEGVIPDATSILISTEKSILRFDRQTRTVTSIASGFRFGPYGFAADESNVFYIGPLGEIVRQSRTDQVRVTLVPPVAAPTDPPRLLLTLVDDNVYFHEGYALKRIAKSGEGLLSIARDTPTDWVMPMSLGIGDSHVYYERMTDTTPHEEINDRGESITVEAEGALYRAPR